MSRDELKLKIEQEKTKRAALIYRTAEILNSAAGRWGIVLSSFLLALLFLILLLKN